MTSTPGTTRRSPLLYPAAALSAASLAWTTWSLIDLFGVGPIGVTVAAGADIIWASVILAEARNVRVGKKWLVPAIGWATLAAVAVLLAWHGIDKNIAAMAFGGPLLPLGTKVVWLFALADMRDPAALTDDERHALAAMERGMRYEEAQHDVTMRRHQMTADLLLAEVETDFLIELKRNDRTRELMRRRPLALEAGEQHTVVRLPDANEEANTNTRPGTNTNDASEANGANGEANVRPADSEPFARTTSDTSTLAEANSDANSANAAGHTASAANTFGFAAALPDTSRSPHDANTTTPPKANANDTHNPRKANANTKPGANTNGAHKANGPRERAVADYLASVANGKPLSGAELGRRYGFTARWGQQIVKQLKQS